MLDNTRFLLSLSVNLLIGASSLSIGSACAMDKKESLSEEERNLIPSPRAMASAKGKEEETEEWEASPPSLEVFLLKLNMANSGMTTEDFYGLEPSTFSLFADLISLVGNSESQDKYKIFRYLVNLTGNQLAALHGRVDNNPELLMEIGQNVPGLYMYSPDEIVSDAFTMHLLSPLIKDTQPTY